MAGKGWDIGNWRVQGVSRLFHLISRNLDQDINLYKTGI